MVTVLLQRLNYLIFKLVKQYRLKTQKVASDLLILRAKESRLLSLK